MQSPAKQAARFRNYVKSQLSVRLHMTIILMAVALTGVLCSKGLELTGLSSLVLRYAINVLICYLAFLLFIRIWYYAIAPDQIKEKRKPDLDVDLSGLDIPVPGVSDASGPAPFSGGGGTSGGGGASASWDSGSSVAPGSSSLSGSSGSSAGSGSGSGGFSLDLGGGDEGIGIVIIGLLLVAVLAAVLGAAGFLIYQAPVILPEAAFDLFLAGGLSRTTRRIRKEGWTSGILRRTWIPFAVLLVLAGALGWALDSFCPDAATIVQAVNACLL